jgi:hypothetical protein
MGARERYSIPPEADRASHQKNTTHSTETQGDPT